MYSSATASYSASSVSAPNPGIKRSATRKMTSDKALARRSDFTGGAKLRQRFALGVAKIFLWAMMRLFFKLGRKNEALHDFAVVGWSVARCYFCCPRTGGAAGEE